MKNLSKVLALVLVVAMVFSLAVSAGAAASFKDDASVEYKEAVQLLAALDVLNGYDTDGDGKGDTFKPGKNITRAELTVMLSYLVANEDSEYGMYSDITKLNKDYKSLCTFADSKDHYAAGFIAFCYGNGYISGRNADTFDPAGNVTVAEAAVMLLRVMGYDAAIEEFGTTANTVKGYNLQLTARNAGLLNGLTDVDFFAPATREQVAQLFLNALDSNVVEYTKVMNTYVIDYVDYYINYGFTVGGTDYFGQDLNYKKLVNVCFQSVAKVDVTNEYGHAGHQWVSYPTYTETVNPQTGVPTITFSGAKVALTDIFVDDTVVASFNGGTAYSKIAATLGVTSATSNVPCEVYVNGAKLTGNVWAGSNSFATLLPGSGVNSTAVGSLNAIYFAGLQQFDNTLPDNCTLQVVRDYDRSVGGTYYKLMYNFEFVAQVTNIAQVTDRSSALYGLYKYTFKYYNAFNDDGFVDYVYDTTGTAYTKGVYYMVVPNESNAANNITGTYPTYEVYNGFLSISVAKTAAPFTALNGAKTTFAQNNGAYIGDGTTTYYVSARAHDFMEDGPAYRVPMGLIFNTAGYVVGYTDLDATIYETGYVYLDSLEFSVNANPSAALINKYDAYWSAQAKALVYFPTTTGNSTPVPIDLAVEYDYVNEYYYVDVDNVNNKTDAADNHVTADEIVLYPQSTVAFYDKTLTNYPYVAATNIRVYDQWFDGWYKYTKYTDGTYALDEIGTDSITVSPKGNPNVTFNATALSLTTNTAINSYTMDMATMTATVATTTGFASLQGTYGFDSTKVEKDGTLTAYTMPAYGSVAGKVTVGKNVLGADAYVTKVDQFTTKRANTGYDYTLFMNSSSVVGGKEVWKFMTGNGFEYLTFATNVAYQSSADGSTPASIPGTQLLDAMKNTVVDGQGYDIAWSLTVENGKIVAAQEHIVVKDKLTAVNAGGWVALETNAAAGSVVYKSANVWNFYTGAAVVPGTPNTAVYYVVGNGTVGESTNYAKGISAMWVIGTSTEVSGSTGGNFPWVWW